jgi:hypothetical protein
VKTGAYGTCCKQFQFQFQFQYRVRATNCCHLTNLGDEKFYTVFAILSLYVVVYMFPFCGVELLPFHQYHEPSFWLRINFESTRICIVSVTCSSDHLDILGADYGRQVDIIMT